MEKRNLIIGIIIFFILILIIGFYIYTFRYSNKIEDSRDNNYNNDINQESKIEDSKDNNYNNYTNQESKIEDSRDNNYNNYINQEYKIKINYLDSWFYKEFLPKPVTISYQVYNYSSEKYDNKFVKENTEFVVAFGPTDILMPTVFRGGDGYITLEIFNGTLEDLFNRSYERSGWVKYYIESGQKNMTFDKFRGDFYGKEITVNNKKAYKTISEGQIPDALEKFKIIEVKLENNNRVIRISMKNVDNLNDTEEIYNKMLSTFEITE